MGVLTFLVAAFLSLPKQFATVYLGTGSVDDNGNGKLLPFLALMSTSSNPPAAQSRPPARKRP